MNYTKNLRLNKPEYNEVVDIEKLNDNFDAIDTKLIQKATQSADGLLSATDKKKLDNIEDYANKIIVDTALSSTSTNPVQNKAVKTELDKKADKTALDNKFDKAGGTLTGNLTGKYITGTWLQTTEATDFGRVPEKIAILDESGWIYYRTPSELLSDIGGVDRDYVDNGLSSKMSTSPGFIEMDPGSGVDHGGYIDFHYNGSSEDYTSRIIESEPGVIDVTCKQLMVNGKAVMIQDFMSTMLDLAYPIGSIYISVVNTPPGDRFGGTWVQIKDTFLLAAGSTYKAGSTGGEATHTLTANEMPAHAHYMASGNAGGDSTWEPDAGSYLVDSVTTDKTTYWAQLAMNNAGGSAAHNNMPPYLAVYVWKRIK